MQKANGTHGTVLSLEDLDARLDVPVECWDRQTKQLIREMRRRKARVEIPPASVLRDTGSWTEAYREQVRRLPRMDRQEEFRMARRYEFLRTRLVDALGRVGFDEAAAERQILGAVEPVPAKARASAVDHLTRARDEFERFRNLFLEHCLHLVFHKVHRYSGLGVDAEDLIQEANASLFQALEGFDWRRDVRFNTYAQYWIHQAILKNLYDASRTVRLPVWIQKEHKKIQRVRESEFHATGEWPSNEVVAAAVDTTPERVEEILASRRSTFSIDRPVGEDRETTIAQTVVDTSEESIERRVTEEFDVDSRLASAMAELSDRERLVIARRFGLGGGDAETLGEISVDLGVTAERVRQIQNAALRKLERTDAARALADYLL